MEKTKNGLSIHKFKDEYGHECSLQASSLAYPAAVWFGVDDPKVKYLSPNGWVEFPMHEDISIMPSRMHLSQDQVIELLPHLIRFAETGELGE